MILLGLFNCLLPDQNIQRNYFFDLEAEALHAFLYIDNCCAVQHAVLFEKLALKTVD